MTDAEIRDELAKQIEQGERGIRVDPTYGPPLMLFFRKRLGVGEAMRIRRHIDAVFARDGVKALLAEPNIEVYQLIDGAWRPVRIDAQQSPDAPAR